MLLYSEIAQLSDKDLCEEIANAKDTLFRQKIGVRTKHLKDAHIIAALKKYLAQLLTEMNRRKGAGEKVEKTSPEVEKKAKEMRSEIEKAQTPKKKDRKDNKGHKDSKDETEAEAEDIATESKGDLPTGQAGVKVKKVEKKKGIIKKVFSKNDR